MNSKPSIWKSRKFWILFANIAFSNLIYWVTNFVAPEVSAHVLWLIGSWQPAVLFLIGAIALEDKAAIEAEAQVKTAAQYSNESIQVAKIQAEASKVQDGA